MCPQKMLLIKAETKAVFSVQFFCNYHGFRERVFPL